MAMAGNGMNQNQNQSQNQNQVQEPADCVACQDQNQNQNQNQNQVQVQDPADCGKCRNLAECGACLQFQLRLEECDEDPACVGERVQGWMQQREELEQCLQTRIEAEIANDGVVAWLQTRSRFTQRVQNRIQNYLEQGGCAANPDSPCDPLQTRTREQDREQARLYVDGLCMDFAVLRDGGALHIPEVEVTLEEGEDPILLMLDLQWVDGALVVTNVALADVENGSVFVPAMFDADGMLHIPMVAYTLVTPTGAERVLYFTLDLELQQVGDALAFIVTNLERIVPED
jgi:hypothetical protein